MGYIWIHLDRRFEISMKNCIFWYLQIHFLRFFEEIEKNAINRFLNYTWVHLDRRFEISMKNCVFWYGQIIYSWIFWKIGLPGLGGGAHGTIDIHWYPLISMDIHRYPWISMDINGYVETRLILDPRLPTKPQRESKF